MKVIFTIAILSAVMLSNCNTTGSTSGSAETDLANNDWYLKKIYQSPADINVDNRQTFIRFDENKRSAGGKGGCNSFGSNYKITGSNISFKNIFSTKMFCEQYQEQENRFFSQLEKVNRYELKDGKLLLYMNNELLLELGR